ncbi:unnamed protein product [Dovyalis caffra]|uniref:Cytochrome P450 n=1 Tax=Dovyalis caffra TaxID=77055 RepID=A0AAV1SL06_9ROSI|nr:unnamed protein product [Dovyalis caffra]
MRRSLIQNISKLQVPPYSFVPFGGGARMCPGVEFAKLETLITIHNLVNRFTWKLSRPDISFTREPLPIFKDGLEIEIQPKIPGKGKCTASHNLPSRIQYNWVLCNKFQLFDLGNLGNVQDTNGRKIDPKSFEKQASGSPKSFVAFGGGPGICPGYEFARLETLITIYLTWKTGPQYGSSVALRFLFLEIPSQFSRMD